MERPPTGRVARLVLATGSRAPRAWLAFLAIVGCGVAALPDLAGAQPGLCDWVNSVDHWTGALNWTWDHDASWQLSQTTYEASVQDAGGCTFELDGSAAFAFSGPVDGDLFFDDDYKEKNIAGSVVEFDHRVLGGPIGAFAPGFPALMVLTVDATACTYTFQMTPWADGTRTTKTSSQAVRSTPSQVQPGTRPIPSVRGSLSFSGAVPVMLDGGGLDPTLATRAFAADVSKNHGAFQDAMVSWTFDPGEATAPPNDSCIGAAFLSGGAQQDTSGATSSASDPTPSCGGGDRSLWFFFFAAADGTAQISTAGSGYPTVVSVSPMTPSCDALASEIACGANAASLPVAANTAYRVQIRRSAPGGSSSLVVGLTIPEPGPALSCAAAFGALGLCSSMRCPRRRPRTVH